MDLDKQLDLGAQLVRAMMGSASSDKIRRIEWWSRARSALETAASAADSYGSLVSVMGRKLQIDVTSPYTASELLAIRNEVADFEGWRRFLAAESLYVVAMAQAAAQERRAEYKAKNAGKADGFDMHDNTDDSKEA